MTKDGNFFKASFSNTYLKNPCTPKPSNGVICSVWKNSRCGLSINPSLIQLFLFDI